MREAIEDNDDSEKNYKKIKSAILNFWEISLPKTVFVAVRIYRKK
jgi:hypothetical protein